MNWKLIQCNIEPDCKIDDSGIYTIINRAPGSKIRLDIIQTCGDTPIISFIGCAEAIRKSIMNWLIHNNYRLSYEHCSYIGSEIARANEDVNFIQR